RHRPDESSPHPRRPAGRDPRPGQPDPGTVRVNLIGLFLLVLALSGAARAQEKVDPKERPQLTFAEPFAVEAGKTVKLRVRGLKLEAVTEVRCHEPKSMARLVGKPAKVAAPD